MVDEKIALRMLKRFEGYDKAYGSYDPEAAMSDMRGGKVEIKSTAYTKKKPVTWEMWISHLNGKQPLGIIPIRDNNTCLWGVIDIDHYGVDVAEIMRRCIEEGYPLVACASKSNGAHLFLFMKEPVAASLMQLRLREMAATIGWGGSEIFPKQGKVALEKGDLGSWLNMPYFGDARWAYDSDGKRLLKLEEFLDLADKSEQTAKWLIDGDIGTNDTTKTKKNGTFDFRDGPPCMQYLSSAGIPEGQRNGGVYALGIYAKKKYRNWEEVLEQWNRDFVQPPLPAIEVADIINRLKKKEYQYPCKDQPIVAHCNSALCRTRKYGVGGSANELPVVGGLSKLGKDDPLWFLDIGDHRLELKTDELMNYRNFQRACFIQLNVMFKNMTQAAWQEVLASLISELNTIDSSDEVGVAGQFKEFLDDFLNDSHRAEDKEGILRKKPWLDNTDENDNNHKIFFRLKDLQKYLNDANFKVYTRGQMVTRIKSLGGGHDFFMLNGKGTRVWWVPANFVEKVVTEMKTPPLEGSAI